MGVCDDLVTGHLHEMRHEMMPSKPRLDFGILLLLAFMLAMAAFTVASSDWAPGLDRLQPTSLAALLLGTLLARSRFRPLPAHLLASAYGVAWIAFASLAYLPAAGEATTLGESLIAFGRHIGEWIFSLLQTGVGKDNFMFLLSMMAIFWLLGYLAAWYTFQSVHVFRVGLLPGLVILVNLYYYGGRMQLSIFLYLYLAGVLLYLARVHYMLREREWRQARIGFDSDVRSSFVRGSSIVALCAMIVAWAVPEFAPMPQFDELWRQVSRPIRSIEDGFTRVFSALEGEGPPLTNPFGRTLGFAGPRALGDTVLMDVYVHPSPDNAHALARYWRAGTYDVYTSNGWLSSAADSYVYRPGADPLAVPYAQRSNVRQTITFYFQRTSLLISAAQPVYFNRDAEADAMLAVVPADSIQGGSQLLVEPAFVTSRDLLRAGDNYDVVSSLSTADVDTLRRAGTDYPDWIVERYLQLPEGFSPRVKDLARQIVTEAEATNPFDQAAALEQWLRRNIGYNEKIEGPRLGQDGVDYVLFESRAGYCDYYAAAMATMARGLGIPARVAVGYARGEYEPSGEVYRVRERDAHAWVEVYFPGYGWVEFEPTAAQPVINRPVPAKEGDLAEPALPPTPSARDLERLSRLGEDEGLDAFDSSAATGAVQRWLPGAILLVASALVVCAAMAGAAIYVVENRGLRSLRGARWAYARLVRLAKWLRVDLTAYQTPYEQAELLGEAAPSNRTAIEEITVDFVRETFGRDGSGGDRVRSIWRQVHLGLWWTGLKRRFFSATGRYRRKDFLQHRFPRRRV